ncbi:MAG: WbqC family protein [Proteobacteria bacterium]|nr:WbqC family protein [Pseudomonadota bacterium]MBU1610543.1 WbqC family protein [Pseudomonadota bacterium]
MSLTVAIHQPNFFPWLGYFTKIAQADVFVFLDQVDYPKSGSSMASYSNRVKLNICGEAKWWGCPVVREFGPQRICDVRIKDEPWAKKKIQSLEQSYGKTACFRESIDIIREMIFLDEGLISAYNISNVRRLSELLGLTCRFVLQSELDPEGSSSELLADIVKKVGGGIYLSGTGGAMEYQEEAVFAKAGIELAFRKYVAIPYSQNRAQAFMPGLSVLDAVMNLGWAETGRLLAG